jgi:manganese/iron transport system substrate-binding protein
MAVIKSIIRHQCICLTGQVFLLLGVFLLGGCSQIVPVKSTGTINGATNQNKKPLVVVTTDVLCDLVKTIAQSTIELKCLVAPGTDPHTYTVTPADRQAIEQANLILYAGYGFEPTLLKAIQATANPVTKVAINEIAITKPLDISADGQKEIDPHVWHDAQNGVKIVETLQAKLSEAFPDRSAIYSKNAKILSTELLQIDHWIKTQIATIPAGSRKLITTHDSLAYYGRAYGIPIEGALQGLSTAEKPTPTRVKNLVAEIKKAGVPTIFAESNTSSKLLETVASEAQVKIAASQLSADGLGEKSSETYPKMLVANTKTITEGLGGQYQAFNP